MVLMQHTPGLFLTVPFSMQPRQFLSDYFELYFNGVINVNDPRRYVNCLNIFKR